MNKDIKFCELSENWLNIAQIGCCYTHQKALESAVKHLNKYLALKKASEIKPYDIDSIIQSLAIQNPNTHKPASKKFLTTLVGVAQRIFDFAIENEIMYRNPAKNKKKSIPKNAPVKIVDAITPEQQQLVINVEHRAKIAAVIMMFMGLRRGELIALEWQDIDVKNLTISVNKRAQKTDTNSYVITSGTKNGKNRNVTIPSNLGKWLEKQKGIATSYLVVPNKSGEIITPTQWKRLWESYQTDINYYCYCKNCRLQGIEPENKFNPKGIPKVTKSFNPHQLRHTYATLLYMSGVDVLTAKELLGHSNIETTLNIYTHLDQKFKKLNISKFDEYIKSDLSIENI